MPPQTISSDKFARSIGATPSVSDDFAKSIGATPAVTLPVREEPPPPIDNWAEAWQALKDMAVGAGQTAVHGAQAVFGGNAAPLLTDLSNLGAAQAAQFSKAASAAFGHDPVTHSVVNAPVANAVRAAGHFAAGAIPMVGPMAAQAGEDIGTEHWGRGLTEAAALLAPGPVMEGVARYRAGAPARAAAKLAGKQAAFEKGMKQAVPAATIENIRAAAPRLAEEHAIAPITHIDDTIAALDRGTGKIETHVQTNVDAFPNEIVQVPTRLIEHDLDVGGPGPNPNAPAIRSMGVQSDDITRGMKAIETLELDQPRPLPELYDRLLRINKRLTAELKKSPYDVATLRGESPEFRALELAGDYIRKIVYDRLDQLGVPDIRALRAEEGHLIELRNAAYQQRMAGESIVGKTGADTMGRRIAANVVQAATTGVGAIGGSAIPLPGVGVAGGLTGAEVGKGLGGLIRKPNVTRNVLIERTMRNLEGLPQPPPFTPPPGPLPTVNIFGGPGGPGGPGPGGPPAGPGLPPGPPPPGLPPGVPPPRLGLPPIGGSGQPPPGTPPLGLPPIGGSGQPPPTTPPPSTPLLTGGAPSGAGAAARTPLEPPTPVPVSPAPAAATPSTRQIAANVSEVDPRSIKVDPERFQFKSNFDPSGVVPESRIKGAWNDNLAGMLLTWVDPVDGQRYVINGHNRLAAAVSKNVPRIIIRDVQAADAAEARAYGAMANIAENNGSPVDAAKVLRHATDPAGKLKELGIDTTKRLARDGLALAQLSDPLFQRVATGDLNEALGIAIGRAELSPENQMAVVQLVERQAKKGKKLTPEVVAHLIEDVQDAPTVEHASQQGNMFADLLGEDRSQSVAIERAQIRDWLQTTLEKDKRLFKYVQQGDRAARLAAEGNVINKEANVAKAQESATIAELVKKLANAKGPINDALTTAAVNTAAGQDTGAIRAKLLEQVKRAIEFELGGGKGAQ